MLFPRSAQANGERPPGMFNRIQDSAWLKAAVEHAVDTAGITSYPVPVPIGVLYQLTIGGHVAIIEQVTRLLPAELVPGRISPGCARIITVSCQKIEIQA